MFILSLMAVSTAPMAQGARPKMATPKAKAQKAAPKRALPQQYAAIAVDRSQNFAYGVSWDQPTKAAADKVAIEEVAKRGGHGSIVLSWSGNGCGAYRTIDAKSGSAYGWGAAATQDAADAIAMAEATKRANGALANNHAWACNSNQNLTFVVIFNDPNLPVVKIGNQVWTSKNADIAKFQNGDDIPFFNDQAKFIAEGKAGRPASYCYNDTQCAKFGRQYNLYALIDQRGFAPKGWRVPNKEDYEQLKNGLPQPPLFSGIEWPANSLLATWGWPWIEAYQPKPPKNPNGFNAVAVAPFSCNPSSGQGMVGNEYTNSVMGDAIFWTVSKSPDGANKYAKFTIENDRYGDVRLKISSLSKESLDYDNKHELPECDHSVRLIQGN